MRRLQNRIWLMTTALVAFILAAVWGLQALTLNRLYYQQEGARIEAMGRRLAEEWRPVRFSQPVSIRFYEDEVLVRIFNLAGANENERLLAVSDPDPLEPRRFIQKYEASGKAEYTNVTREGAPDAGVLFFGTKLANPVRPECSLYLYIIEPLGPLNSVQEVLRRLLLGIAIAAVLLALLVSYFMARRIARPIEQLTEQAGRLGQGDYSVHFHNDDITEIHQLAESLNAATAELAKLDETKTNLLANVSHDLRTPLTMIKAYAEMIRDLSGGDPVRREEHIGVILEEADWMSDLITDILEYSRIRSGNMNYEMRLFDLAGLTDACAVQFGRAAAQRGKHVAVRWENPGYMPVWGDVVRVKRVISNLLDNAIRYSPEELPVEISLRQDGRTVRWQVCDHGPGVPEENRELIWDRYFSRKSLTNRQPGSTGLGLAIVRGILEAHGASYGVESAPDGGAVFWFSMNRFEEESAEDAAAD